MGKTHKTENFPVASLLLAPSVRAEVLEFYRFARQADDIADAASLSPAEKHKQLHIDTTNEFQENLLKAFRQDIDKNRYETWDELIGYCENSANPVGRFLLSVHGETSGFEASDALCTVLQILNHLQDCQKDYKEIDRIYLPSAFLDEGETYEDLLSKGETNPSLRKVIDECLKRCDELLKIAINLPSHIKSKRLRYQAKVTLFCAFALAGKLKKQDPLATRVELSGLDKFLIAYKGLYPL